MIRALALCALVALPAAAQTPMRPQEEVRLARLPETAGAALLRALAEGDPGDVASLTTALSGTPQIAFDESLVGIWSCRTIKLGGLAPLVVYSPFRCRIGLDATGAIFEKLSGSQRTVGRIEMRDGRAIYLGVGHVADATPPRYEALDPAFVGDGTIQPQVALFERVSPTRARLIFPAPVVESDLDILELTR